MLVNEPRSEKLTCLRIVYFNLYSGFNIAFLEEMYTCMSKGDQGCGITFLEDFRIYMYFCIFYFMSPFYVRVCNCETSFGMSAMVFYAIRHASWSSYENENTLVKCQGDCTTTTRKKRGICKLQK